ncbi:MAG TPA: hypothetical protein VL175_10775 [Pirellulales bacterium]|jgi:uncharacterized repeat protein (TIGR01451 family)|nr:hypothetical protein [Pirellulales bacterium]
MASRARFGCSARLARYAPVALLVAVLQLTGCAYCRLPRIDPTGERLFLPPDAPPPQLAPLVPAGGAVQPQWGISVSPSQVIAPVGSEVVMIATVCGSEGFMLTRQRVEWNLSPDGVGQFLSPGERQPFEVFDWFNGLPRKVDSRYVVNSTVATTQTLDRGTPLPNDDVLIQAGQSWATVTSPTEGTSHVTVFAPEIFGWDRRQQTATIHWVDAQWRLPAPSISAAGSPQLLSTVLTRQSDNTPLVGWPVRYQITGGPEAGFAPDGATSVEVLSGPGGEAQAELIQKTAAAGTSQIAISIVRPATTAGSSSAVPLGAGSTLHTWTIAGGPVGMSVPTLQTPPPGSSAGVTLGQPQPAAVQPPVESRPGAIAVPNNQQPPREQPPNDERPREPRPEESGAAGGQPSASAAVRVTVQSSVTQAQVGQTVQFTILVTNLASQPVRNLEIANAFETALQPARATENSVWLEGGALGWKVDSVGPGATIRRALEFTCLRESARSCNRVTVTGANIEPTSEEACIEIAAASAPAAANSAPAGESPIEVTIAETADPIKVGGETVYQVLVANKSKQSVFDVTLSVTYSAELRFEGTTSPLPERPQILPTEIRFPPAREIRAGENPLSFEMRFKGLRPGAGKVKAQVMLRGQPRPVTAEQETEVLE